jgi:hypothetical protein
MPPATPLPRSESPEALSPATRALAAALAAGRTEAGPLYTAAEAQAVARAVQTLIREELGRSFGETAMTLSRPRKD